MKSLTDREQNIVLATIYLWNVNAKSGYIPDYELSKLSFELPLEAYRDIRSLVQEVCPRTFTPNASALPPQRSRGRQEQIVGAQGGDK